MWILSLVFAILMVWVHHGTLPYLGQLKAHQEVPFYFLLGLAYISFSYGLVQGRVSHIPLSFFSLISLPLIFIDQWEKRIPNRCLSGHLLGLMTSYGFWAFYGLVKPHLLDLSLRLGLGLFFYIIYWLRPNSIGLGDVKMLAVLLLYLPFSQTLYLLYWLFLLLVLAGLLEKKSSKKAVPELAMAPYLCLVCYWQLSTQFFM